MESPLLRSSVAAAQCALSSKPEFGKNESPIKSESDGALTPSTACTTPMKSEVTVQKQVLYMVVCSHPGPNFFCMLEFQLKKGCVIVS